MGVYRLARVSVRLLATLDPTQQASEVESLDPDCVLDMNTAIDLQKQCFELSKSMDCRQGDRSIDEVARRCAVVACVLPRRLPVCAHCSSGADNT